MILQDNDYILYIMQIGSLTRVAFIFLAKSLLILTSIGVRVFIQKYVPLEKYKYLIALGILGSIFVYITYKFSSVYALIGWIIYLVFAGMLMGIFFSFKMGKGRKRSKNSVFKNKLLYRIL